MLFAHIEHEIASVTGASQNRMVVICCHHQVAIWYLTNGRVLTLDLDSLPGNHRLEFVGGLVISRPQNFLSQYEAHWLKPIGEAPEQAFFVIYQRAVSQSEYSQHYRAKSGFARALLPALEHDNHARALIRILHGPR